MKFLSADTPYDQQVAQARPQEGKSAGTLGARMFTLADLIQSPSDKKEKK